VSLKNLESPLEPRMVPDLLIQLGEAYQEIEAGARLDSGSDGRTCRDG
jgi:hypothetical protein